MDKTVQLTLIEQSVYLYETNMVLNRLESIKHHGLNFRHNRGWKLKHNASIIGKISSIIEKTSVLLGNSATTNTKSRANMFGIPN